MAHENFFLSISTELDGLKTFLVEQQVGGVIIECHEKFKGLFVACCGVQEPDVQFNMDESRRDPLHHRARQGLPGLRLQRQDSPRLEPGGDPRQQ